MEGRLSLLLVDIEPLIERLRRRGQVIGPRLREGRVVLEALASGADLPRGWRDETEAGRYRLLRDGDACFGVTLAPDSFKRFLYPPHLTLWRTRREPLATRAEVEAVEPFTLLGLRACDLAAVQVLDRVLLEGPDVDADYRRRRQAALLVAVACTHAAPTCFCVSMGTGPDPKAGFDLLLTELAAGILVESGSAAGDEVLSSLEGREPGPAERAEAAAATDGARRQQRALPERVGAELRERWEDPRWAAVAERCLACGNCTLVCPTCFCVAAEQGVDIEGAEAVQSRRWDSCFAPAHSYVHGGAVRGTRAARYRQWLTHKLSTWEDQFGTSGCVGCGRCITWCPAAIDITEEAGALVSARGGGTR